ncbi:hypothetical protein Tco_1010784 [Tanacetum coccineum]
MSWSLVSWVLINRGLIHWGLLVELGIVGIDPGCCTFPRFLLVLVLVPNESDCWLGVVLAWEEKPGGLIGLPSVVDGKRISLVEICAACLRTYFGCYLDAGAGIGDVACRRSRALNHIFQFQATSGDTRRWKRCYSLTTMALLRRVNELWTCFRDA